MRAEIFLKNVLFLFIMMFIQTIAQNRIYTFQPDSSLILIVGEDTVYAGNKMVYSKKHLDLYWYKKYEEEFQREKESSIYFITKSFDLNLGESVKNDIISRIKTVLQRKPNFEDFIKWLETK